jgi:segregation and condensation protein B
MSHSPITDETVDTPVPEPDIAAPPADTATEIELPTDELALKVEAALMATDRALPAARLSEVLAPQGTKLSLKALTKAVAALNKVYETTKRSFRIEQLAGGWQILTLPKYAEIAAAMNKARQQTRLSPAALETLAIVAYKQPVLKADVEAIRGVACGEVIRALMERKLVKITGRSEELGRPMLYGTTKSFLEVFGLSNLKDLPKVEELKIKNA